MSVLILFTVTSIHLCIIYTLPQDSQHFTNIRSLFFFYFSVAFSTCIFYTRVFFPYVGALTKKSVTDYPEKWALYSS